ncbi:hypothetical protein ScPMuIL_004562 [Solemya velum]
MRCLHMFLLLAVVVVCTFLSRANGGWTSRSECKKRKTTCIRTCFKIPCYMSCNRVLLQCIASNEKKGEPTNECWSNNLVCYKGCHTFRACLDRCASDNQDCLTTYEPDE